MKHYMDIERMKPSFVGGFCIDDRIVIQEKIDGANFSFRYDAESGTIKSFSRNKELDLVDTLRGAWNWAQKLDPNRVKDVLGTNRIMFAEWLVKHSVPYPKDMYQNAYCYDVYDESTLSYLGQDEVRKIVCDLGLNYVPVFYDGPFISWDHVRQFVGQTRLGGDYGEGVVVKNQTRLNDPNNRLPFYTKIVCEKFAETKEHKIKLIDPEELAERQAAQELTESIVTEARVRKLVNKLVDSGVIPEEWGAHDMATIARNIGKNTYEDCVKEEPEIVSQIGEKFGKYASSTAMGIVKEMLKEKENAVFM